MPCGYKVLHQNKDDVHWLTSCNAMEKYTLRRAGAILSDCFSLSDGAEIAPCRAASIPGEVQ